MEKKESSKEVKKSTQSDKPKVAKVVAIRNRFFFMLYRYSSLVFLTSIICMFSSIFFFFYFIRQPVAPQYVAINEDGTYIKATPLSECKPDSEVQRFMTDAINKLYKYDYINYADQIQASTGYFTSKGWNDYLDSFKSSGTLLSVKENKWIVSVEPNSVPVITRKKVENNVCTWELKTPITMMYIGNNTQSPKGDLYVRISRNSVINNPEGLGITRIIFAEKK